MFNSGLNPIVKRAFWGHRLQCMTLLLPTAVKMVTIGHQT